MADNQLPSWAGADFKFTGNVRTYYMAAEQITWNYAASGWDNWMGVPLNQSARAYSAGYTSATGSIGGAGGFEWQKAAYRGYTNSSFTERTVQPSWNGLNGPIMRAEVGDMIQVVFTNKLTANYMNVHSMGLGYDKTNEGSVYINDLGINGMAPNTNNVANPGDSVPPGGCFTYKWLVGPADVPAPGFDSHLWSYHPYINMAADLTTGLAGPVIIYSAGKMDQTMRENREFILHYQGYLEIESWLTRANVQKYAPSLLPQLDAAKQAINPLIPPGPGFGAVLQPNTPPFPSSLANSSIWVPQLTNMAQVGLSGSQAPLYQALNGHVLANMPAFEMCQADTTIWYVMAFGQNEHSFHLHGNNYQVAGDQTGYFRAVKALLPGEMYTMQMNASRVGTWQMICHLSGHLSSGMQDLYLIHDRASCPLPRLEGAKNGTIQ